MKITRVELFVLCLIIALIAGATIFTLWRTESNTLKQSPAAEALRGNSETPNFTDLAGNPISFDDYLGKVLIVNVWASWSPFSATELPALIELSKNFPSKDVAVIAINRMESNQLAEAYSAQFPDTGSVVFVQDLTDSFYTSVGGFAMPETIVYDQKGAIAIHTRGPIVMADLQQLVTSLLSNGKKN